MKEKSKGVDDISSAIYHETFENKEGLLSSVKVRNLTKKFGDFTAVDKLSLNLYPG